MPPTQPIKLHADDVIRRAQEELDAECEKRRHARVKEALRDLYAAQQVVKQLERRVQEIAADETDLPY